MATAMTAPTPPQPPPQAVGNAPLQRTRSEFSLPVIRPHDLVKHHSIDSQPNQPPSPSRRLSMPYNKPLRGKYALPAARSTHRRLEVQRNAERFERMMDRFQLRRVALPRSLSNNSTATLTSQRDTPLVTPYTSQPTHEPPRFAWARENEPIQEYDQTPSPPPRPASTWAMAAAAVREPLHPTGCLSQLRMGVVSVVFITQLAYVPFVLVYSRTDSSITSSWIRFDLAADFTCLISVGMLCNMATYTARGQLVTTRRAILRQYRRQGLLLDVLAVLPLELAFDRTSWWYGVSLCVQLSLRCIAIRNQCRRFELLWANVTADEEQSWLDWLLFSRFGHLVRIGRLVVFVVLLAHYMACMWTLLSRSENHADHTRDSGVAAHVHSAYDVLQLLQGQGLPTSTPAQDLFCSFVVLLGSITLAVIFGHVAVLVANFSANQTAYQRKMENVFAIMGKLQLPHPIRERVHQYYEYIHTEYESLDGEIGKFTKDLSHTLELEVVLFKYMDVVMNVPHWRECSPDFQKQLVLNMSVRVYLPDDFIIRRGDVGTSCYIISRGVCKQYEYPNGNDEPATHPLVDEEPRRSSTSRRGSASLAALRYTIQAAPGSNTSTRSAGEAQGNHIALSRGQAIGEKALFTNYKRTSDVRAFTYVEMCVLERESFQRILTRYPLDRRAVLTSFVGQCMKHRALQGVECELMGLVHRVTPLATVEQGVAHIVEAMSPRVCHPTILFGATEGLEEALQRVVGSQAMVSGECHGLEGCNNTVLAARVDQLQSQMSRIEQTLQSVMDRLSAIPMGDPIRASQVPEQEHRRHATKDMTADGAKVIPQRAGGHHATRMYRRASETLLRSPIPLSTHSAYADRLFQAHRRRIPLN